MGILAVAGFATSASAVIQTIADGNTVINIDDNSSAGMRDWTVDGTDHMFQQWFWYRLAGDTQEASIDTLGLVGTQLTDTNTFDDPRPDTMFSRYQGRGLRADIRFIVSGGAAGSGASDVAEIITLTNQTNAPMSLSFFQYSDFDLNGTPGGEIVFIPGPLFNTALQSEGFTALSETVVTTMPDRYEAGIFPATLTRLNDGNVDVLNNNGGPIGPADTTWAFQWDFILAPGDSVIISKDKNLDIIPTPGALALLGMGGLLAARRRR